MKRQSCISSFVFACQFSFTYILIAITLHFGKVMMLSNEITPFDYLRVVLLTQFGANFISQLIASVSDLSKARMASENILGVIKETAVDMNNLSDEGLRPKISGRLMLKNVEFRYPSRPIYPVLRSLTLKLIDDYNVKQINPAYLRRVVVSVGQEPTLFSFTIRENIGYGLPEDEATEQKIVEAAKIANIHDFILSLPQVRRQP
ncbi:unnamed protein product [Gongylonema pulchrum]|uniref:ABC transmembrane type-1 domain-containing protein n=1 Tax=Gongylonema pulchrum TaxID=637853 RepID=A0A183EA08_9BILA|nr:unnamed protein product [Gongylonema pulchrum]